ncbi:nuclear transport factor 2 family protein [Spirosoma sordidisoli]|uniref:Nuclear transport factor 2 family protein n=1 Tax=Spirosoma sordidisoli TaxID=2502893 RepID=A0A4Q2ULP7_9BACT|nr:nuclear transport factor 2 family protein [Spirosoma sordidisoli]RYC70483.1 nuclear transport factor 2 family protein [Spirosoma sordidisoli]
MNLPDNIAGLIKAQNDLNSTAFAGFFTAEAQVSDEGSSYSGRDEIKQWIQQASEKYQMQLKPLDYTQNGPAAELTVEVSGTFPGSPAVLQYHLELDGPLIRSLRISG